MRKCALFIAAFFFTISTAAFPQSLADLADREKERRREVGQERVITDEEAARFISTPANSAASGQPEGKPEPEKKEPEKNGGVQAENKTDGEKPDPDEPVDFEGRTESYWRKTLAEARKKIAELENQANVIVLKINRLQNEFYSEDNGFKRQDIQKEISKSFYEQDVNKEELSKAREILLDLEKEARKSGALPGWIR